MKVILQQDVKGQGKKGQLIEASEGYARNYLLPRKLAIAATADAINTMNLKEKARRAEEARQKEAAMAAAERLKALLVKIPAKAGSRRPPLRRRHHQGDLRRAEGAAQRGHPQAEAGAGRPHQGLRHLSGEGPAGL